MKTQGTSNRTSKITRLVAAGLVLAGGLAASQVEAGPVEDVEQECLQDATGTPDSLDRWAEICGERAAEYERDYTICMLDAPGTPDSLERWVDHCVASVAAQNGEG